MGDGPSLSCVGFRNLTILCQHWLDPPWLSDMIKMIKMINMIKMTRTSTHPVVSTQLIVIVCLSRQKTRPGREHTLPYDEEDDDEDDLQEFVDTP